MPILPPTIASRALPRLLPVRQCFPRPRQPDVFAHTYAAVVDRLAVLQPAPGARVALGVGSRGICDIVPIVRATVAACRDAGLAPCIVPAMGSHGGATAEGQRQVLEHLGISADSVGAPIVADMQVAQIGETTWGMPLYFDAAALAADLIIPINRIKPHTDFAGTHESGLAKMLVIGFGNHVGCSRVHQETFARFATVIPQAAALILEKAPVAFGVAVVENAYDETYLVETLGRADMLARETELLQIAYANMPRLYFDHIDVLLIDAIGKDISGAGMDPNIVGRTGAGILAGYRGPSITRIVVAGLTPATAGNAMGIGSADFTTPAVATAFDPATTYANAVASGCPESVRMPVTLPTVDDALRAALLTSGGEDWSQAAVVRIQNTLHLDAIWVSAALAAVVDAHPLLQWGDEQDAAPVSTEAASLGCRT